jgi:hypothetical protein
VSDGRGKADVAHALAPDGGSGYFDTTPLTLDTFEADVLVFPACALPVLLRTKDRLAEEAIALRSKAAIVDGLRLGYLTIRPRPDLIR